MENKKKTIFNVIFLLVVFTGTMYGVFHGEDIGEIVKILEQVNVLWLIPGVICVVVFIWGESIIIYYMMRTLKIRLKKWTCFCFHRLDSSLAVSHLRHLEDSRHRFII